MLVITKMPQFWPMYQLLATAKVRPPMASPFVAMLVAVGQQYMDTNNLEIVTPDVIAAIIAASNGDAVLAGIAIQQISGG